MSSPTFAPDGAFARFAVDLIDAEFPDLPAERRADTVEFCRRRAGRLPTHLALGVRSVLVATTAACRVAGRDRVAAFVRRTSLPAVGDLPRLVRSLAVAYIWERWPDTAPTGAPATRAGAR